MSSYTLTRRSGRELRRMASLGVEAREGSLSEVGTGAPGGGGGGGGGGGLSAVVGFGAVLMEMDGGPMNIPAMGREDWLGG